MGVNTSNNSGVMAFLTRTRTRGNGQLDVTDTLTYIYLLIGTVLMFGPVLWLVMSSFKSSAELARFPPRFLPYEQEMVEIPDQSRCPCRLYDVTMEDGSVQRLAQIGALGRDAIMVDPEKPEERINVPLDSVKAVESVAFSFDNYTEGVESFNFWTYFKNSVIVTGVATILTLLTNSMAAFALSKYQFRGRNTIFLIIIGTLMVPLSVILIPVFWLVSKVGLTNNLLGVIIPGAATPTGVFLLRQYMLTIPDELLDSARIDGASEWRIYLQIILPLATPALSVLAIFSIMWRWNDFLWPLIVLSESDKFTLQLGLASFRGDVAVQWDLTIAMTVLTIIPISLVFFFLQRYITTGIATTGMK